MRVIGDDLLNDFEAFLGVDSECDELDEIYDQILDFLDLAECIVIDDDSRSDGQ